MKPDTMEQRVAGIRQRMQDACKRVGRDPETVRLVAVSKTYGPERVTEAAGLGLTVFGENRVREAGQKIPGCPSHIEWHLVGHLQTNKVKDAVRLFSMVHSVDSQRLITALNSACEEAGVSIGVLLQVNVAGDSAKYGFKPEEAQEAAALCGDMHRLDLAGLMTMPPLTRDPEETRGFFKGTRQLKEELEGSLGFALPELSMGMTNDFEVAVEEGATLIRVGRAIFGERNKQLTEF